MRKTSEVDSGAPAFRRSASSSFAFSNGNPRYSGTEEEKWWFRGKADTMDLEVVIPHVIGVETGEEGRFDILSPEMSFALYAGKVICTEAEDYPHLLFHRERRGARCMDLGYPNCKGIPARGA